MDPALICRSCGTATEHLFVDLQAAPPSNAFLTAAQLGLPEPYYPLVAYVCPACMLVQIDEVKAAGEIFGDDYVYFSSANPAFVRHAENYVEAMAPALGLDANSFVVEAASNDGYLLQFFNARGVPCLGVEPSGSTAKAAREKGVETLNDFFSAETAAGIVNARGQADLFLGNNVVAHVPDLNDFLAGIALLLKPEGTATLEFPHLLRLIEELQFDTIYHEHFSYFSLGSISAALARHGLAVHQVEEIAVHGGSLRIHFRHADAGREADGSVARVASDEAAAGLGELATYDGFQKRVDALARDFLRFLLQARAEGKRVAGYGAAAKGNTLLNYCGVKPYLIDFVSDVTPAKQGRFLPGSRIPVFSEAKIAEARPDYIVILAWNWKATIVEQLDFARDWGAKFVTVIPELVIE